jgi:hypothetical protein
MHVRQLNYPVLASTANHGIMQKYTTMQILISYEVDAKQAAVREIMKLKGYEEVWVKGEEEYRLPGSALWKSDISPAQAMDDLKRVARALNIQLLGASAIEFTDFETLRNNFKNKQ